jgi:hypothetical protein
MSFIYSYFSLLSGKDNKGIRGYHTWITHRFLENYWGFYRGGGSLKGNIQFKESISKHRNSRQRQAKTKISRGDLEGKFGETLIISCGGSGPSPWLCCDWLRGNFWNSYAALS